MGLNSSSTALTDPLEINQMMEENAAAQNTFSSFLTYLDFIITHRDAEKYREVLFLFLKTTPYYKTSKDMAIMVMTLMYKVQADHAALSDLHKFFDPRSVKLINDDKTGNSQAMKM